ncbi:MAG: LamG domain-containing protein [Sedimentisphaerales bacterium]|nr:LamG domain-containing protein [Sedimentisphaerales bacterium]
MSKRLISFVLVLGLVLTSMAGAADPDLAAHWKFDDGSGTTAVDSSGNGNDGVFVGDPQWVPGRLGGALEFDGDDYLNCGNGPSLQIRDAITITFWFKVDAFQNTWEGFMAKGDDSYRASRGDGSGNATHMGISGTSTGGGNGWFNGVTIVTGGQWHHYAATYDGAEGKIYIDGVLDVTSPGTGQINESSYDLYIGENSQATGRFFHGLLDDMRIYSRALMDVEILGVMAGSGTEYPLASSPIPENGAYHPDTWVNLGWRAGDYAVTHDIYLSDNFDDVSAGAENAFQGNQAGTFLVAGFPGFAYPDGLVPGTTYYWRIDEVNDTEPNSPWKGDIWSFTIPPKTAYLPDPADGGESVSVDVTLGWTPGFGAKLHTVYFGETFDEVDNAAGGSPQGMATYTPSTLKMAKTYYWRVDEFDIVETHKGDVWSFTTEGAVGNPNPANRAMDVSQTPTLTWTPGFGAAHEIYFGADEASLELKSSGSLGSESFAPGQLEWNTTYYWRVDEADNANADSPWTGPLWSFTTANFLIIDDMESYNDIDEGQPGSNRIYLAWIDGFDSPSTNGSVVGNLNPPFAEQSTVHGGLQSMPFAYDNAVGKSEATLNLTSNKDWTVNGVDTLVIWYVGNAANAAEQMYVTLNGSAKVNNDNPDAAVINSWTEWKIDLQAFADQGVNLANVNSITLGLSSVTAGSGMLYFDDIGLYLPAP